jgi:hypothetical protein
MTLKELLYHRTQGLYRSGDLILAGNWGRLILGIGPAHNRFYAEYLLDRIRLDEFPSAPSRLVCAFAFEDAQYTMEWRGQPPGYVYAVRLADPTAPQHRGNMDWIDAMNEYRSFEGVEECARHYWRGDDRDPQAWEVATIGGFVVEDRLTRIPENGEPDA